MLVTAQLRSPCSKKSDLGREQSALLCRNATAPFLCSCNLGGQRKKKREKRNGLPCARYYRCTTVRILLTPFGRRERNTLPAKFLSLLFTLSPIAGFPVSPCSKKACMSWLAQACVLPAPLRYR